MKKGFSLMLAELLILLTLPGVLPAAEGEIDTGTTCWMLTSTALVLLMVPGLAMFYGGLVRTKNVLGTMMHSFVAMSLIGILWVVVGYSLTFGKNVLGGLIGWNNDYFMLRGIDDSVVSGVPEYVLAMFQGKFAIITPALISGALAERVYFRGYTLFISLWFLLVYCPLCHWVWAPDGWLFNAGAAGVIDLAGGTVIHVSAGFSALIIALLLLIPVDPLFAWGAALSFLLLFMLNKDLFFFFCGKKGVWFMLGAIPLHFLYFLTSGLAFALALARHLFGTSPVPARDKTKGLE